MTTIRSKMLDLVKQTDRSDLSLGERVKLRIALRFAPRKLIDEIAAQAMAEGFLPAGCDINEAADGTFGAQIDWEALAEFIKAIMPLIIQLITLFL